MQGKKKNAPKNGNLMRSERQEEEERERKKKD